MKIAFAAALLVVLALSAAHAAGKSAVPPEDPQSGIPRPYISVRMTDVDTPDAFIPAVTAAMHDPVYRQRRLAAVSRQTDKEGRAFDVAYSGTVFFEPPKTTGSGTPEDPYLHWSYDDGFECVCPIHTHNTRPWRARYDLDQKTHASGHLNGDGTAAVDLTVEEYNQAEFGIKHISLAGYAGLKTHVIATFRSGETRLITERSRADGVCHLVFATVVIHPVRSAAAKK